MKPVIAIALLSLRNTIRSKMVLSLLLILTLVIILLPLTIKGDGTMAGFIQILLSYTLGLSSLILALTTLWAGAASVASEINDKTIQTLCTKPVSKLHLWVGKWIGLNIMNLGLLACCGAVTYGMLLWHIQPSRLQPGQQEEADRLLTARQKILPIQPDFDLLAKERLRDQLARAPLAEGTTRAEALRTLQQQAMADENTIRPAGRKQWDFGPVSARGEAATLTLRYRFATSIVGQDQIKGRWLIGTADRPDMVSIPKTSTPRSPNEISFPYDPSWEKTSMLVTYIDEDTSGSTLLFDLDQGILLLTPRGEFVPNYIRSLLIVAGQLAFFSALGLTTGCLFSLPVAAFVSMFLFIMVEMGSYIQGMAMNEIVLPWQAASPEDAMGWGTILVAFIYKALAFIMTPLIQENALNNISSGQLISLQWTLNAALLQGVAYSLLFGWLAAAVMDHRELALPQS